MPGVAQIVIDTAQRLGVDPRLALEMAVQESGLSHGRRGAAGEIGVMQLMPATAAELGVNPYDLADNIRGGVLYLRQQLARFGGDYAKALAAYNCGPGCVGKAISQYGLDWLGGVPTSTQRHVAAILDRVGTAYTATIHVPAANAGAAITSAANSLVAAAQQISPAKWLLLAAGALILFLVLDDA